MPKRKASGPLTREQLADLAQKSLHSAVVLISDATDLYEGGSAPHAYSTAILAGEEFGKCQLAVGTVGRTSNDAAHWKEFWSIFYNHGPKLARAAHLASAWIPTHLVDAFVRLLEKALRTQRRELGLYVDVVDNAIVTPGDAIAAEEAREAIEIFVGVIDFYDRLFKPPGWRPCYSPSSRTQNGCEPRSSAGHWRSDAPLAGTTGALPTEWQLEMIQKGRNLGNDGDA